MGRSNQISLIIGILSGKITKKDLVKKLYSSYSFLGYCYDVYNIKDREYYVCYIKEMIS